MMIRKALSVSVIFCFILTTLIPPPKAQAHTVFGLPLPGTMVNLSPAYEPVIIKGLTVHKDNPFLFDFIVDVGQDQLSGEPLKKEGEKLIKYFLASLAIPDKDVWVNLSPYEKNRVIPESLGQTDMGRDLLEQDYILKQISASLIYPERDLGKKFWDKVYTKAQLMYGTTQVPVNTFSKVWIMADRAEVYEHNQTAFVVDSHLKVMLEEDYLALSKHQTPGTTHSITSRIIKEIVLPELEKEVNTGRNFANLRQIFNSIILSSWYKKNLKEALLNQVYSDKAKIKGIDLNNPKFKELIYEQYIKAYKKGVFNYIKEDMITSGALIPRRYFSGGLAILGTPAANPARTTDPAMLGSLQNESMVSITTVFNSNKPVLPKDAAMLRNPSGSSSSSWATFMIGPGQINLQRQLAGFSNIFSAIQLIHLLDKQPVNLPPSTFILPKGEHIEIIAGNGRGAKQTTIMVGFNRFGKITNTTEVAAFIWNTYRASAETMNVPWSIRQDSAMSNKKIHEDRKPNESKRKKLTLEELQDRFSQLESSSKEEGVELSDLRQFNDELYTLSTDLKNLSSHLSGAQVKQGVRLLAQVEVLIEENRVKIQSRKSYAPIPNFYRKDSSPPETNPAMKTGNMPIANLAGADRKGGIDLNTSNGMQWKVSRNGKGFEMNIDPAMIARIRHEGIDGLSPVILRMTPVTNIWSLVGLQEPAV